MFNFLMIEKLLFYSKSKLNKFFHKMIVVANEN